MINNFSVINIYESPNLGSKLSSQMLYGEKFRILNKKKNWLKIKKIVKTCHETKLNDFETSGKLLKFIFTIYFLCPTIP